MKKLFFLIFILAGMYAAAQTAGDKFSVFAKEQNTIMVADYKKKDVVAYRKHLASLQTEYNKLNAADKKKYKDYITDANYNLACTYAVTGDKKNALLTLKKSQYYDYDHLIADDDLNSLMMEPQFIQYLKVAKTKKTTNLATLRTTPAYNYNEHKDLPIFTYQSAEHAKLKLLRKKYNLDSIAGYGTDVSRMINLMRWVHNSVKHDGSKGNPDTKNALHMLKTSRRDGKTLNCRGMALMLNEIYLAQGIPSRIVTCLPKDPDDNDCHVINMAWSSYLRKWVWMDPTFLAYVMNEKGEVLSIEEVRDRLIHNRPLVLNPDADHNHTTTQTRKDYLESYMAKNLYKLECPASSEYNYETLEKGKERTYVQLLGGSSAREPMTSSRRDGMNTYHIYYTANPKTFWKAPPGQTRADFDLAMAAFKTNYNALDDAAINESFSHSWDDFVSAAGRPIWAAGHTATFYKNYGKMLSYKYLGQGDDGVTLYKVTFEKSTHAMGFTLDGEGKFGTHRLQTSSPEINEMLVSSK